MLVLAMLMERACGSFAMYVLISMYENMLFCVNIEPKVVVDVMRQFTLSNAKLTS